jgi:hypothetical protein
MFKAPKPPQEDPKTKALREAELVRSEADRIAALQDQLGTETRIRNRSFGLRSLLGPLAGGNRFVRSLLGTG